MFGVLVTMADGEIKLHQETLSWPRGCSELAVKAPPGNRSGERQVK